MDVFGEQEINRRPSQGKGPRFWKKGASSKSKVWELGSSGEVKGTSSGVSGKESNLRRPPSALESDFLLPPPGKKKRSFWPSWKKGKAFNRKSLFIIPYVLVNLYLIISLAFSEGGVMDFLERRGQRDKELFIGKDLVSEINSLKNEIKLIKTDSQYQYSLVREHLGVIAEDEFLIVFPRDPQGN